MAMKFSPGDRVQMTGEFLRNTGQIAGGEGFSVWVVRECECGLCETGRFISTDERNYLDDGQRHINVGNLRKKR